MSWLERGGGDCSEGIFYKLPGISVKSDNAKHVPLYSPKSILHKQSTSMDNQDWTTVQIRGKKPKPTIIAERPSFQTQEARRLHKVEDTEDVVKRKRLTAESRRDLAAARIAQKKSQRDVDAALAFPPNTVRDFEAGTVVPNNKQFSALHRYFSAQGLVLRTEVAV